MNNPFCCKNFDTFERRLNPSRRKNLYTRSVGLRGSVHKSGKVRSGWVRPSGCKVFDIPWVSVILRLKGGRDK